ncbi:MAG: FkbM family methyltransferase [Chloroflexi bacterium]|nr:FkbM family methyltransferase [Chloroflexota bacterium]
MKLKLPKNGNIYIYGTGTFARDVLNILIQRGLSVKGFLDHIPHQLDLPVMPPDTIPQEIRLDSAVVLGIHNRDANIAGIISRLKSLDFSRIITPVELYDDFADDLGTRFWLTSRDFYADYRREIDAVSNLFTDETSRDLYNRLIQFRLAGDYSILPGPDLEHQYFPADIPVWKTPLRFVDCGAYDGDTLTSFINAGIPIEAIAAFEPDENNFRKLSQFIQDKKDRFLSASLWPCGVFSSTTQLKFSTGRGEASNINTTGNGMLQCVSLDEAIPTFAPNLIKMDVEGAEYEALLGAKKTIMNNCPGLAIAVYHRPEHIWQIPLLIKHWMDGEYTYHLRAHAFNDFEVIFYAVPK